jgi:hypothetical protein
MATTAASASSRQSKGQICRKRSIGRGVTQEVAWLQTADGFRYFALGSGAWAI